jgi:hypothetical protein
MEMRSKHLTDSYDNLSIDHKTQVHSWFQPENTLLKDLIKAKQKLAHIIDQEEDILQKLKKEAAALPQPPEAEQEEDSQPLDLQAISNAYENRKNQENINSLIAKHSALIAEHQKNIIDIEKRLMAIATNTDEENKLKDEEALTALADNAEMLQALSAADPILTIFNSTNILNDWLPVDMRAKVTPLSTPILMIMDDKRLDFIAAANNAQKDELDFQKVKEDIRRQLEIPFATLKKQIEQDKTAEMVTTLKTIAPLFCDYKVHCYHKARQEVTASVSTDALKVQLAYKQQQLQQLQPQTSHPHYDTLDTKFQVEELAAYIRQANLELCNRKHNQIQDPRTSPPLTTVISRVIPIRNSIKTSQRRLNNVFEPTLERIKTSANNYYRHLKTEIVRLKNKSQSAKELHILNEKLLRVGNILNVINDNSASPQARLHEIQKLAAAGKSILCQKRNWYDICSSQGEGFYNLINNSIADLLIQQPLLLEESRKLTQTKRG